MKRFFISALLILFCFSVQAQEKIMSYNLLNYPGNDTTIRNPYFRTVISSTSPDILVVQEIISQSGVDGFLANVMNSFGETYAAGTFINGIDTDNAIFYKPDNFNFISNTPIYTTLRNTSEFTLVHKITNDTLRIYSVHLKAGSTSEDQLQRDTEVDSLRKVTDRLAISSDFIVCGDYNMQASSEIAFQKLLNQSSRGYFIDPLNLGGIWNNNSAFAPYHTQSPRTRSFGGGATGGMDDRFDMILISQAVSDTGGITLVPGSYTAYGNDGLHFNDSINRLPNNAVGQTIANALHYASDHLPVFASFRFDEIVPVEIYLFTAVAHDDDVELKWITATETNNYGFNVERKSVAENHWSSIGFVPGHGTSSENKSYSFYDNNLPTGKYEYRLKQIDYDGTFDLSPIVSVNVYSPMQFSLEQNFPNPYNNSTTINYFVSNEVHVTIKIFDVLGNELSVLVNEIKQPGEYKILYSADDLAAGFYFYQMRAGNFVTTRKMILLK